MSVVIRLMTENDIQAVQHIAEVSWHDTYENIIPLKIQERFLKLAYNMDTLKKRLKNSIFYVAETDGKLVGFANYSPINKENRMELAAIYIHPVHQNQSIGSRFLDKAIASIPSLKEIYIDVERDNHKGRSFYIAKGFTVVKEFEDDFDGYLLQTIRMVLKLTK